MRIGVSVLFLLSVLIGSVALGATTPEPSSDKTLAPYFVVNGESDVEALPLRSSAGDIHIAGVIAHVRVTQVYQNTGNEPLEAVYVFPMSTRAAVFGMKMTIGERVVEAQIDKREAARKMYEKAKEDGKSASLLEQQRPNVFQMNVANILPGDEIEVALDYTELIEPTEGTYELVYPAVVGPRYSEKKAGSAPKSEHWLANPYLRKTETVPYDWDVQVHLAAGLPVADASSPSHDIDVEWSGKKTADITLSPETKTGDRDFVLRYRLGGGKIETGMLLFPGEKDEESFFLMMMQPPERVAPASIPPREYTFVVDVSGSMYGFPLNTAKVVLGEILDGLRPEDYFNILFFSGGNHVLSDHPLRATPANLKKARAAIDGQKGGGGTRLLPALQRALSMRPEIASSRTFVVVTDGYVAIEKEAFDLIRDNLDEANLFAFGIGSSVNRHLIEGMARAGMGTPFVVLDPSEAEPQAKKFAEYIGQPVLTDIDVQFDGFEAYDVEPPAVGDLFAARPVLMFGKYKGRARGAVTVTGVSGEGDFSSTLDVRDYEPAETNQALRYLWARHRIATLDDFGSVGADVKEEVTGLGLKYHLMTAYTSFVAVDQAVRNETGEVVTVKQPLPLPKGVSEHAVGGGVGSISLHGTGSGGGGTAYGVGGIGTKGHGSGSSATGYGVGYGTVGSGHKNGGKATVQGKGSYGRAKASKIGIGGADAKIATGYDKSVVDAVIKRHLARIQYCFEKELRSDPGLSGKLIISFTIDEDGRVKNVRLAKSTMTGKGHDVVEQCVVATFKKMRFPAPKSESVKISYPILFQGS